MTADSRDIARRIRSIFEYSPDTGRLKRVAKGRGARIGIDVGYVEGKSGYRRIHVCGKARQASAVVWAWHNGDLPKEDLIHINGDFADDRIENLAKRSSLRRPVQVAMYLAPEDQPETMLGDLQGALNTGIYQITNVKNGRTYVGSAVNVSKRWREHLRQLEEGKHHSRFMQRCWNKHGGECFVFRVLVACQKEHLIMYEQLAIDSIQPKYNSAPKAGSQLGLKMSDEAKVKMAAAARRTKNFTGCTHSEETKRRISEKKKGVKLGPYGGERKAAAAAGMRASKSALNESLVRRGRLMRSQGATAQQVADAVGCSVWAAYDFLQKRTYSWVD